MFSYGTRDIYIDSRDHWMAYDAFGNWQYPFPAAHEYFTISDSDFQQDKKIRETLSHSDLQALMTALWRDHSDCGDAKVVSGFFAKKI